MGITSLQVCMDSSDWLQGTISEEYNTGGGLMDPSPISTPSGGEDNNNINNLLACSISPPLLAAERSRLRPQHEQSPKCPRCESTHTKFCYYNNYSLSQPRYFCKTCRRYWTKGGTLRNIPVGGGCRKNKKSSSSAASKKSDRPSPPPPPPSALILNQSSSLMNRNHNNNPNDEDDNLHLGFSDQLHFSSLNASSAGLFFSNPGNFLLESNVINNNQTPIEFMDSKYDNFVGNDNNGENFGGIMAAEHNSNGGSNANSYFHGFPFGFSSVVDHHGSINSAPNNILESCQRLMMPYDHQNNHYNNHNNNNEIDVKPSSNKILSLEWNDHHHHQQAATTTKDSFGVGYNFGGLGSWTGLMNGYGSSATNPLV